MSPAHCIYLDNLSCINIFITKNRTGIVFYISLMINPLFLVQKSFQNYIFYVSIVVQDDIFYLSVTPPCFPNLELISAVQPGTTMTIFTDIKIACHASVWAISLYSMAAGTVWVDIWRPISHSHYILEGTVEIVTSDVGVMNVTLAQPLPVQPGYVIGYHCSSSETVPVSRTAGGVSSVLVFTEVHESGMFTKGLRTDDTNLVSTQTVDATLYTPHLDLHLANGKERSL